MCLLSDTIKLKKAGEKSQLSRYDCHLDIRHSYFQCFSLKFQNSKSVNNWKISIFNNFKERSKYKIESFPIQISNTQAVNKIQCKQETDFQGLQAPLPD